MQHRRVGRISEFRGHYSEGIDINPHYADAARSGFPNARLHVGCDLRAFEDNRFETVVASDVLEHIPDDALALSKFVRIARFNELLSVPKEDAISPPHSRVTYRPYLDPTHVHYYTKERLSTMVRHWGGYTLRVEDTY